MQPLDQLAEGMLADVDGFDEKALAETRWTVQLVWMTPSEFEALGDFQGH